jgi:CRISPR-associated protein Cas2
MNKQFLLIVYDISDDKRRTKLHNRLKDFGTPVQFSVFECLLTTKETKELEKAVNKIIKPRQDRVRYYSICQRCLEKTKVTSGPEILHETTSIIV